MTERRQDANWNVAEWHGTMLVDRDGERIGKLQYVYVDVENDERQFATVKDGFISGSGSASLLRPPICSDLLAMPDFERTSPEGRGQAHHERANHRGVLLGVLMLDEELPRRIDEHRLRLRP
jgi:hypothetical protein